MKKKKRNPVPGEDFLGLTQFLGQWKEATFNLIPKAAFRIGFYIGATGKWKTVEDWEKWARKEVKRTGTWKA